MILFDFDFDDRYYFCKDNKGNKLDRSPKLEKLWTAGFSSVANVTFDSAKYTAIYLQKQMTDGRKNPFVTMSKKPGIGAGSLKVDWLLSDKMYLDGYYKKLPRYYLDLFDRNGHDTESIREKRKETAKINKLEQGIEGILHDEKQIKLKKRLFEKIFKKSLDKNKML